MEINLIQDPYILPFEKKNDRIYFCGALIINPDEQAQMLEIAGSGKSFDNNRQIKSWGKNEENGVLLNVGLTDRNGRAEGYCSSHECKVRMKAGAIVHSLEYGSIALYNCRSCLAKRLCEQRKYLYNVIIDFDPIARNPQLPKQEHQLKLTFDGRYQINGTEVSGLWEQIPAQEGMLPAKFVLMSDYTIDGVQLTGQHIAQVFGIKMCQNFLAGTCMFDRRVPEFRDSFYQDSAPFGTATWHEIRQPGHEGSVEFYDICSACRSSYMHTQKSSKTDSEREIIRLRNLNSEQAALIKKLERVIVQLNLQLLPRK